MADFFWNSIKTPKNLNEMLKRFAEEYPAVFHEKNGKRELVLKKCSSGKLNVSIGKERCVVEAGTQSAFARGIGSVMAGCPAKESTSFKTIGIMLDCSRNKVFRIDYLKKYLIRIALMGYNMAMLYTEDTYRIPGEPLFGYMRGAYTLEELRELDAFAKVLGIELIGCIQTLGHLEQMLRYYPDIADTRSVLRVDEPKTYRMIEKMISFWKKALSSNRIHIGMDETHDLGRGKFLDLNGYEKAFELFNRHLGRVNEICRKNGLTPIIWSDMYFRLGNKNLAYYDLKTRIPAKVKAKIPKNVQLCYWDYYHDNASFYEQFIKMHRELGFEPILGSGVWTWLRTWYDHQTTRKTVTACIKAGRKTKLKEIFFTMWGDNGGYCLYNSSLAGLEFASGLAYGNQPNDEKLFTARHKAICGRDYMLTAAVSQFSHIFENNAVRPELILWDDPLYCMYLQHRSADLDEYGKILKKISAEILAAGPDIPNDFRAAQALADAVAAKITLRKELFKAYEKRNRAGLLKAANELIPAALTSLREYDRLFAEDWRQTAKPFGLEVIQRRNAGAEARLKEARRLILELLQGKTDKIEELDAALEAGTFKELPPNFYTGSTIM